MGEKRKESFEVVGLSKRVTNDDPASIGDLWETFRNSDLRSKVGDTASREVYCVYHDYDGGFAEPFCMTIGYRVSTRTKAPNDAHRVEIPAQYVVPFAANGPQPQTLISRWQTIWQSELSRAYVADYDVYDADNPDLVTVFVGVTSP